MPAPLDAHTFNEARYYLMVTPCGECGKGPWEFTEPESPPAPGRAVVDARCENCGNTHRFEFVCKHGIAGDGGHEEVINPTDEPSRIVDVAQWVSLFYLLIERAAGADKPADTRRAGYRAALCLAEAMKFYAPDEELPGEDAFFSDQARTVFRDHPEKFARGKLRDMQSRLPSLPRMAERVSHDRPPERKWWQFWRR